MKGQQPQWRHISDLPVFTDLVDGMLESAVEQLATLRECEHRPSVLDDHTLNRFIVLHTEQRDDHWLYEQQFARWKRGTLSDSQAQEVNRLIDQSIKLKAINEKILALAEKIAPYTIDKIMAMDDFELGLKVMSGEIDRPGSKLLPADMPPPVHGPGAAKTFTYADKCQLAERIHKRVTLILKTGGSDLDIFAGMADYMEDFKSLMDTSSPGDMERLCARYEGFYRYAKTLENIAQGIEAGDIHVP